jgi:hypothetical protein
MQDVTFNYLMHNLGIEPAPKESEGMKFRKWFHKMGGDKNFTEDQISTAIANKFKN